MESGVSTIPDGYRCARLYGRRVQEKPLEEHHADLVVEYDAYLGLPNLVSA